MALALWIGAGASHGQPAMPEAVRFAVRVEDGAAWRAHGPTRRVAGILMAAGAPERVRAAWSELAGTLGMEDGPAFDALLGKSMVLCLANESTWGVLGAATAESAGKLEAKLDPAPRGFEDGRAVMLVERGKYRLTKLPAAGGSGGARMVLTPGESSEPIDLTTKAAEMLAEPKAGTPGASWYWRVGEGGGALWGTTEAEERGWRLAFKGEPGVLGLTAEACAALAKSEGETDGADAEALLEVAARTPEELPGLSDHAKALAGILAAARVSVPAAGLLGSGFVVRVSRPTGERAEAGLDVLLACEVNDRSEGAPAMDTMMVGVLDLAWRMSSEPMGARDRDFRREIERAKDDPGAVRLVVLGETKGGPAGGTLAWTTVGPGLGAGAEGVKSGWWVAQFTPGAIGRDEAERGLQERARRVAARRWGAELIRVGMRPADLWKASAGAAAVLGSGPAAVLREVERLDLTVRAGPRGVEGEGRATTIAPPVPAAPALPAAKKP